MENDVHSMHRWSERFTALKRCAWYWGDLTWKKAEKLLEHCDNGSFLIRDSRSELYLIAVSYKHNDRVFHTRIETYLFFLRMGPISYHSLVENLTELIQSIETGYLHMLMHKHGEEADATELKLIHPVTRVSVLPRLKYLCRMKICSIVKTSDMTTLPLPKPMIPYLTDEKYFAPDVDEAISYLKQKQEHLENL